MEEYQDGRNKVLNENLQSFWEYCRLRRRMLVSVAVAGMVVWATSLFLFDPALWMSAGAIVALVLLMLLIAGICDWQIRKEVDHAEKSLEICRTGFINDLKSNDAPKLKDAATAIGHVITIVSRARVHFDEREKLRNAAAVIAVTATFVFLSAAIAVELWHPTSPRVTAARVLEEVGGVLALVAAFFLSRPKLQLHLQAFDWAERTWFEALGETLEALKRSSATIGDDLKGDIRVGAPQRTTDSEVSLEPPELAMSSA